jgi:hypothetical protein
MNITTVEDKKRVVCEASYYLWMQMEDPSFSEILVQICKECGSCDPPIFDEISKVISCTLHGVVITIDYSDPKALKTKMVCHSAKHHWVSLNESDRYTPLLRFFQCFLRNLREVWYQQYRADTGV